MLRYLAPLAAGALLLGLAASPAPHAAAATPKPEPTNPFNLNPISPPPQSLPIIGTTHSKPVCTAIRRAVAPAVQAAMKNDQTYGVLRKTIFDYVVKDSEPARDLHLMQMDRQIDGMVKNMDAIETALKSPALDIPATAKPEDAKMLRDLKKSLSSVWAAQKTELNAMSGFVETERMRRFGQLSESELAMQSVVSPNYAPNGVLVTPAPISGFLRDTKDAFNPQHPTVSTLNDAHLLDRDLGDIAAVVNRFEQAASQVIVPAANSCK